MRKNLLKLVTSSSLIHSFATCQTNWRSSWKWAWGGRHLSSTPWWWNRETQWLGCISYSSEHWDFYPCKRRLLFNVLVNFFTSKCAYRYWNNEHLIHLYIQQFYISKSCYGKFVPLNTYRVFHKLCPMWTGWWKENWMWKDNQGFDTIKHICIILVLLFILKFRLENSKFAVSAIDMEVITRQWYVMM